MSIGYNVKIPTIRNDGNILYVGGSGPGNYTKIQDAIDNSSDGDTVFVYDDSSPYYEHIVIDNSIKLIGEDRNSTIIDGNRSKYVVILQKDEITISGFTIQKSGPQGTQPYEYSGICIFSHYNKIEDNKILNNNIGIAIVWSFNNFISKNIINDNGHGVMIYEKSDNNIITRNKIVGNSGGIEFMNPGDLPAYNNKISWNDIRDNQYFSLILYSCSKTTVYKNNIENSEEGIFLMVCGLTTIRCNNFINLDSDAVFYFSFFTRWSRNYWGRPMFIPKVIKGYTISFWPPKFPPDVIECSNYDFWPAKIPYQITTTQVCEI